jgi:Immunity protein 53
MSISTLEEWYSRQCNGKWEHGPGVTISTIDNPGWSVDIPLRGTRKETTTLERIKIDRGHDNWIHYWVEKQKCQIRCGPLNLSEAIEIFSEWFKDGLI